MLLNMFKTLNFDICLFRSSKLFKNNCVAIAATASSQHSTMLGWTNKFDPECTKTAANSCVRTIQKRMEEMRQPELPIEKPRKSTAVHKYKFMILYL